MALVSTLIVAAGSAAPAQAEPDNTPVPSIADSFLVDKHRWFCPSALSNVVCSPNRGSAQFAQELVVYLWFAEPQDRPAFMRVTKARNDCEDKPNAGWVPGSCTTGVPAPPPSACPPIRNPYSDPFCALRDIRDLGVRLGVTVGAAEDPPEREPRKPKELAFHACEISKADTNDLLDFMFLDLAFKLSSDNLQLAVEKITRGQVWDFGVKSWVTCDVPAGVDRGWPRLITNDTTWPGENAPTLDTDAWAHARHMSVLEGEGWRTRTEDAAGPAPAVKPDDYDFIAAVKSQGAKPILRFEVTHQSSRFASLDSWTQCRLLKEWANLQVNPPDQPIRHYKFIFPFYIHGLDEDGHRNFYDSIARSTLGLQFQLIDHYNPGTDPAPSLQPC